jgi:hypothetical protein
VGEGDGNGAETDNPIFGKRARHIRFEDVELFAGDIGESALRHTEVFGEDVFRGVGKPIGEQESLILIKAGVVEDEQELATVTSKTLDRVWDARREEPSLAFADIVLVSAKLLIDQCDPGSALEHVRPLPLLVPMQLSDCTGFKPHVDAGKLLRLGSVPWSVNGGDSLLGLSDSRAGFVGPISVAPFLPRIG